jgi:hypothetical protein
MGALHLMKGMHLTFKLVFRKRVRDQHKPKCVMQARNICLFNL